MKLQDHFKRFLEERKYLKNVSIKTLTSYRCGGRRLNRF
jgi:hypothetical protein